MRVRTCLWLAASVVAGCGPPGDGVTAYGEPVVNKTWAGDVTYLKNWIRDRVRWMDTNMPGTCR